MVVHFPDLALKYDNELVVDNRGGRWRLSTDSHHNHVSRTYTLRTRLQKDDVTVTGRFIISEDLVMNLDQDEDLRLLAIREIKKYLDREELQNGFVRDLPYRFLL